MVDTLETSRDYRAIIPLSFLQISDPYAVPTRFCESLKNKTQMCINSCIVVSYPYRDQRKSNDEQMKVNNDYYTIYLCMLLLSYRILEDDSTKKYSIHELNTLM